MALVRRRGELCRKRGVAWGLESAAGWPLLPREAWRGGVGGGGQLAASSNDVWIALNAGVRARCLITHGFEACPNTGANRLSTGTGFSISAWSARYCTNASSEGRLSSMP